MIRIGDLGWWAVAVAGFAGVALWNGANFVGAPVGVPRTKDLTFLPRPEVAEILACGHPALAAKLRWIDSFDYFELQLDLKDDTVAGEAGQGYTRLYDILLGLDPRFAPYYDQAALNLGAVESRHFQALGILLRGIMEMPENRSLWQQAAIELYTTYDFEHKHPRQMEDFLAAWAAASPTDVEKRMVYDWIVAMGRRQKLGLTALAYWQEQLAHAQPNSPPEKFITATMQDLLANYARGELQALADAYQASHLAPPLGWHEIIDPQEVAKRYPNGLPHWGPLALDAGHHLVLRSDPLGYPYGFHLEAAPAGADGRPGIGQVCRIDSTAVGILACRRLATTLNLHYLLMSDHPPTTLAEMLAVAHPAAPPPQARWVWRNSQLELDADPPPAPAWNLRAGDGQ